MKCWQVIDNRNELFVLVYADTAGKARAKGAWEMSDEFLDVRVLRVPMFDGEPRCCTSFTDQEYFDADLCWNDCWGCGKAIPQDRELCDECEVL